MAVFLSLPPPTAATSPRLQEDFSPPSSISSASKQGTAHSNLPPPVDPARSSPKTSRRVDVSHQSQECACTKRTTAKTPRTAAEARVGLDLTKSLRACPCVVLV